MLKTVAALDLANKIGTLIEIISISVPQMQDVTYV